MISHGIVYHKGMICQEISEVLPANDDEELAEKGDFNAGRRREGRRHRK
jgi:hypothetical protein